MEIIEQKAPKKNRMKAGLKRLFFKWTKKKIALTLIVVAAVLIGGNTIRKNLQADPGAAVSVTGIQRQDIEDTLGLKAVLEGRESAEVMSRLYTEVLAIHVQEGDKVAKGQLLATLDSTSLLQEVTRKENALALDQLQLQEVLKNRQIEYEKALTALKTAQVDLEQAQALFEAGGVSRQSVTDAEGALAERQRAMDSFSTANGKVTAGDAEKQAIANARQALDIDRQKLDDGEIRSPIDGTVTRVNTKVGHLADASINSKPLFAVENIENLQMKVMVSEHDIARIKIGQEVEISADILNGSTVAGVVERISPTGEPKEGALSERVVPVYIGVTGKDERLISGITAKARIKISLSQDALTLPYEAIVEPDEGSATVYKVNEDRSISIIPVILGIRNDLAAEIISDRLNEGDLIIINPSPALAEGMIVNPT